LDGRTVSERLEEMVKARTRDLEQAQEELLLKERLAVLGNLSGSISHELRNPLAAIDSSAYLLNLKCGDDDNARSHLQRIAANVRKATGIIQSLLDLSRMEKPRTRPHDLRDLMSDILETIQLPETIRVATDYPDQAIRVTVDAEQIRMALKNIFKNAIQAMEGAGTLSIAVRTGENGGAEIAISDTGPGIREEHLGKVFQPLFSTKVHGIGFGLSIVKMVVEKHGGDIFAAASSGQGATFTIVLPRTEEGSHHQ
jgi:signal transduction histidine kinase